MSGSRIQEKYLKQHRNTRYIKKVLADEAVYSIPAPQPPIALKIYEIYLPIYTINTSAYRYKN